MFNRLLKLPEKHSFFLFGARGTGKSTELQQKFANKEHLYIDLLDANEEEVYAKNPNTLIQKIESLAKKKCWVVIDEVQKIPKLLDIVHLCIEKYKTFFALTGSSARKLKRGRANLLAGRAFVYHLHPLTHLELKEKFDLNEALQWGSLPEAWQLTDVQDKMRYLRSYTQTYLKEEILVEQIIRKLNPFRAFLEISAQQNGEIINYSNIARDVGVDTVTVQSYFQILEDTLMGFTLSPFHQSIRKRQRTNPKFYYFDLGVKRSLDGTLTQSLIPNTYGFGKSFEHFVITEAMRLNSYFEKDFRFSYLRTKDNAEIDLIIERPGKPTALIEIKSSHSIDERHTRMLENFLPGFKRAEAFCFCLDPMRKKIGNVQVLPWQEGFREIGLHELKD